MCKHAVDKVLSSSKVLHISTKITSMMAMQLCKHSFYILFTVLLWQIKYSKSFPRISFAASGSFYSTSTIIAVQFFFLSSLEGHWEGSDQKRMTFFFFFFSGTYWTQVGEGDFQFDCLGSSHSLH